MQYTANEMARLLGVPSHTLRYYEKIGIIRPWTDKTNGYRYYSVVDTRRFNLCRALRAADFSLEDCRELLTDPFSPESRALLHRQAEAMRRREVLARLTARQLERMEQDYAELEQRMDRMEILTLPAVWMLTVARCETPVADRALEEEKQQWLECLPLVRWVSRIPRSTMEQFGQGRVAYSSGLMIQAEDAEALGFVPSERVQLLPGGRLLSTVWRQTGRGPFDWDSLRRPLAWMRDQGIQTYGDGFSTILASRVNQKGEIENYHYLGIWLGP